jgi:2-keto-3-deoxy-L-rhamnonate aldolase RhmA
MNPFRHLLKASGPSPALGTWILSAHPLMAEAMGHAGFDWAVVDMEHAPADLGAVVGMLQAIAGTRLVPVVRVPWNEPVVVKRVLDAGAQTVMFPFVQDADEARAAVAATRYPPAGLRGLVGMSRATRFGTRPNWVRAADADVGVIVQIESRAAVESIEAIASVPGVDGLFIGPADLSASIGKPGDVAAPAVLDLMVRAIAGARRAGKPIGTIGDHPQAVAQYRAMGFDYLAVGSDLGLMMRAAQSAIQSLRTPASEHVHTLASGTHTSNAG